MIKSIDELKLMLQYKIGEEYAKPAKEVAFFHNISKSAVYVSRKTNFRKDVWDKLMAYEQSLEAVNNKSPGDIMSLSGNKFEILDKLNRMLNENTCYSILIGERNG